MRNHFGKSKVWRFYVEVSLDDLEIWRNQPKEIVGFFVGQIA